MIILITGQSGNGKTAHVVDMIAYDPQFKGRPVFSMGIPDLKIEHSPCPPVEEWTIPKPDPNDPSLLLPYFTFPENAIIVLDEAQRVFRPRAIGSKVPESVQAFETHRHCGIDFILITQHAGLIDSNIRKNIGKHIHIRNTAFGRYRYEWTELGDPESASSRDLAAKSRYKLPSRAFQLYKSTELHTQVKAKIPMYFWIMLAAFTTMVFLGIYVYSRINKAINPQAADPVIEQSIPGGTSSGQTSSGTIKRTTADVIAENTPRIPGLVHTAPKYDELTKPTEVPWPSACYKFRGNCKCLDQQGNHYETTQSICEQIITKGIFQDFRKPPALAERDAGAPAAPAVPQPANNPPVPIIVAPPPPLAGGAPPSLAN